MSAVAVQSIAHALRESRYVVAKRWLDRIAARVTVEKELLFPSENLLDEVPLLIEGLARTLTEDAAEITTSTDVVAKARELGAMRFEQGFSSRQILWEYDVLGGVILQYLDEMDPVVNGAGLPQVVVRRLLRGLAAIQRASMEAFLHHAEAQVHEREQRLRGFNRALSHEVRNEVAAIMGAGQMLREKFVAFDDEQRERFASMVLNNAGRIERVIENLLALSRSDGDVRQQRNILLGHAVQEVARRLRAYAEAQGVRIEIHAMPELEVNAALADLALTNLIANAIKYHRRDADRWVRVQAAPTQEKNEVCVEVADNGIGVPEADRPALFGRFFRAGNAQHVEGTGLGLSLVADVLRNGQGRIWADFPQTGETIFAFTLPARRVEDAS
jgi:signal transduction histidine kinase